MFTLKVTIAPVNFLTMPVKLRTLFCKIQLTITRGAMKIGRTTENVTPGKGTMGSTYYAVTLSRSPLPAPVPRSGGC